MGKQKYFYTMFYTQLEKYFNYGKLIKLVKFLNQRHFGYNIADCFIRWIIINNFFTLLLRLIKK